MNRRTQRIIEAAGSIALLWSLLWGGDALGALTGHWKLQDNAASTTIVATVGSNGTLNGGANTADIDADGPGTAYPKSLEFDGTDDRISVTHSMSGTGHQTIAMWVRGAGAPGATTQTVFGNSTDNNGISWGHSNATFRGAAQRNSGGYVASTFSTLNATTWYHLAVTWDGTNLNAYKDGTLITAAAVGNGTNATTISFASNTGGTARFPGRIADVRVYDEALNEAAIDAIIAQVNSTPIVLKILQLSAIRQERHLTTYGVYALPL